MRIKTKSNLKMWAAVVVSVFLLMVAASAHVQAAKVDNTSGNETGIPIPILPPIISVERTSLQVNETGTINVDLDLLPVDGFSYANVSIIMNSSVAEFTGASFPDWAVLNQSSTVPSSKMWFKVGTSKIV